MIRFYELYKKYANDIKKLSSKYSIKNTYYKKLTFSDMQYEENNFLSHIFTLWKRNY